MNFQSFLNLEPRACSLFYFFVLDENHKRRYVDQNLRATVSKVMFDDVRNTYWNLSHTRHLCFGFFTCEYEWTIIRLVQLCAYALRSIGELCIHEVKKQSHISPICTLQGVFLIHICVSLLLYSVNIFCVICKQNSIFKHTYKFKFVPLTDK